MTEFTIHTLESAPEASKPTLEEAKKAYGAVPNLHAVLAEAPAALEAYDALWKAFGRTSLSPIEKQVVYLTSSYENECHYCMAGHSVLARMAGMESAAIEALREGTPLPDPKLDALRGFAREVVTSRGRVSEETVSAFLAAGYTRQSVLEVILGISVKVLSNYTNHIANTPFDPFMKDTAWTHPDKRSTA